MRRPSAFCPRLAEALEDRAVPSHLGATPATPPRQHAPLSPQALASDKVTNAFSAFEQNFTNSVNIELVTPSYLGSGSNTVLFSQQLGQELVLLERGVRKALGHAPSGSAASSQIHQLINGSGPYSLRTRLTALTRSSLALGSAFTALENTAIQETRQTYARAKQEVNAAFSTPSPTPTPSPTTATS